MKSLKRKLARAPGAAILLRNKSPQQKTNLVDKQILIKQNVEDACRPRPPPALGQPKGK